MSDQTSDTGGRWARWGPAGMLALFAAFWGGADAYYGLWLAATPALLIGAAVLWRAARGEREERR